DLLLLIELADVFDDLLRADDRTFDLDHADLVLSASTLSHTPEKQDRKHEEHGEETTEHDQQRPETAVAALLWRLWGHRVRTRVGRLRRGGHTSSVSEWAKEGPSSSACRTARQPRRHPLDIEVSQGGVSNPRHMVTTSSRPCCSASVATCVSASTVSTSPWRVTAGTSRPRSSAWRTSFH